MTHAPLSGVPRAASDAAERGWHVFPLRPGDKRPAPQGEATSRHTGHQAGPAAGSSRENVPAPRHKHRPGA